MYPFLTEIESASGARGIDPALVAAFCFVESSFQTRASRYEELFQGRYIDRHSLYSHLDPEIRALLATSMGLMQVMGVIAHELGLPIDRLMDLYTPATGLEYGVLKLSQLLRRYRGSPAGRGLTDAVAAYNAGSVRVGKNGDYSNRGYVNRVMAKYRELKGGGANGTER